MARGARGTRLARSVAGALAAVPLSDGLREDSVDRLKSPDTPALRRASAWLAAANRHLVTLGSEHYPPLLANIADPPLALWVEGAEPALLSGAQLAMVGSRNPTSGGRDTAEQFSRYLAERGLTITSGLAIGIDGASHRGALEQIGGTIAVLGSGLDTIYPHGHTELARSIAERWLLVSEYPPGTKPSKHHFPQRNRIIAGLTLGTLVVEATLRSGSLITAKLAAGIRPRSLRDSGLDPQSARAGLSSMIRNGAKLVEEAADIFVELAPQLKIDLAASRRRAETERIATLRPKIQSIARYWIRSDSSLVHHRSHRPFWIDGSGAFLHAPRA